MSEKFEGEKTWGFYGEGSTSTDVFVLVPYRSFTLLVKLLLS